LIQALADECNKEAGGSGSGGRLVAYKCDMESEEEINEMFQWIHDNKTLGKVDCCIANAGMSTASTLLDGTYKDWQKMMNINVLGLNLCVQQGVKSMLAHGTDDGQVVLINSMSGHRVPPSPDNRFYAATKHAVTALLEAWRQELRAHPSKNNIRVSSISPGVVETDKDDPDKVSGIYNSMPCLQVSDIADSVRYVMSAPVHVQVHDILMRPTQQGS